MYIYEINERVSHNNVGEQKDDSLLDFGTKWTLYKKVHKVHAYSTLNQWEPINGQVHLKSMQAGMFNLKP